MKNLTFILILSLFGANILTAQPHFRGIRIINGHSVETLKEGEMESSIGHRFGRLNGGAYELFGLDQATIRIGFDYGINNRITVGLGRSSFGKHYDSYFKIRLLEEKESGGSPISMTGFGSIAINTLRPNLDETIQFRSRLAYTGQVIIAKKITERFTAQLMPTMVHLNLVETSNLNNDIFVIGLAGKAQVTKNISVTTEYYYTFPNQLDENKTKSFSVGFDLNTGSHVFQLHFTNSAGMIEKAFIGETTGKWLKGDIHFGFNMVRTFKLKGRRY